MQVRQIAVRTGAGEMPVHIARGGASTRVPLVVFYMDALGWRDELRQMAARIAALGYFVAMPNLFYRAGNPSFDPS